LVILDMIMPGMAGQQVFQRLRAMDAKARVLLSSGYSEADEAREIMAQGCDGFIQKPFDLNQISRQVRLILDRD
jgi:DNA-binding NtrC family response regulator